MALVHRHVDGLADDVAKVVDVGQLVQDLGELVEVGHGAVAPFPAGIADEGRAVHGGEDLVPSPDPNAAIGVARVLGEFSRAGSGKLAREALGEAHAAVGHVRTSVGEATQRLGVIAELDALDLEHPIGLAKDGFDLVLAQKVEKRDLALNERRGGCRLALGRATTAASSASAAAF